MTFAQRLAQHTESTHSKETFNAKKQAYTWDKESKQKRPVR